MNPKYFFLSWFSTLLHETVEDSISFNYRSALSRIAIASSLLLEGMRIGIEEREQEPEKAFDCWKMKI